MLRWKVRERWRIDSRTYVEAECAGCSLIKICREDSIQDKCFTCDVATLNYKSRTYGIWDSMRQRCNNPNASGYKAYGAVGIRVCERWDMPNGVGWLNFLEDMGEAPEGLSLDRFPDGKGNYSPDNCRWATASQQGFNQKRRSTNRSDRTGVTWDKKRESWYASICVNRKTKGLIRTKDFELAVFVREEAELSYFGFIKE